MRAEGNLGSGERVALNGFMAVNRARLKGLPPEALAELVRHDALELLYLHLQSMRHFSQMMDRLGTKRGVGTAGAAEAGVAQAMKKSKTKDKKRPAKTKT